MAVTLRNYLTERFGFPAFALTTTEMQDEMVRRGIDRWQARIVGGLLNQCDAVVYARYRPAIERADADLTAAYEIVEMSRPGASQPKQEAGGHVRFADPYLLRAARAHPAAAVPQGAASARVAAAAASPTSACWPAIGRRGACAIRWLPTAVRALALALLVVALARPQTGQAETELPGQGIDIVLVLDTSSSMTALSLGDDTRLAVAQKVIHDFIEGREEDRVGLVIFRDRSLVLSPLTLDYEALRALVDRRRAGQPPDGTAIGVGLSDGLNLLRDSRARSRVVILLTDGENNAGEHRAAGGRAHRRDAGHPRLHDRRARDGSRAGSTANVDERALQEMAQLTGGRYFAAESESALDADLQSIDQLEKSRVGRTQFGAYDELAVYFLVAALLLLALELALRATVWRQAT